MQLSPREIEILTAVVEDYIASAQPVGSRTVSRRGGMKLSPASIRNTMSDLTDQGYLDQPHASAGRVPTARAFRLYLDEIMRVKPLTPGMRRIIGESLRGDELDIDDLLRQAAKVLSALCHQVSMVIAPDRKHARLRRVDFALIKPGLVMAVLILQGGMMVKRLIADAMGLSQDELTAFGNYLNKLLRDSTLGEARSRILRELRQAGRELSELCRRALLLAGSALTEASGRELIVGGRDNLVIQPEFSDIEAMRELLFVLEERDRLLTLLDKTLDEAARTVVTLGPEAAPGIPGDCSLVSTPYGPKDHPLGVIGLIGPIRMDYAQVVPVVGVTARLLTGAMAKRF
jgi:heat-inducible transcriptional repressor